MKILNLFPLNIWCIFIFSSLQEISAGDDSLNHNNGPPFVREILLSKKIELDSRTGLLSTGSISILSILTIWHCRRKNKEVKNKENEESNSDSDHDPDNLQLSISGPSSTLNNLWIDMNEFIDVNQIDEERGSTSASARFKRVPLSTTRRMSTTLEMIEEESS